MLSRTRYLNLMSIESSLMLRLVSHFSHFFLLFSHFLLTLSSLSFWSSPPLFFSPPFCSSFVSFCSSFPHFLLLLFLSPPGSPLSFSSGFPPFLLLQPLVPSSFILSFPFLDFFFPKSRPFFIFVSPLSKIIKIK